MSKNLRITNSKFIDQTSRISFKFDGKTLYGFKGDTLASALLAKLILKDYILIVVGVLEGLKLHQVQVIYLHILLLTTNLTN